MLHRIFKKTYRAQMLYPNNQDIYQYIEDYYSVYETELEGTKFCFYNRNKSIIKKTEDGGKTFTDDVQFTDFSYFTAIGVTFDEIMEDVISTSDGLVEEIKED